MIEAVEHTGRHVDRPEHIQLAHVLAQILDRQAALHLLVHRTREHGQRIVHADHIIPQPRHRFTEAAAPAGKVCQKCAVRVRLQMLPHQEMHPRSTLVILYILHQRIVIRRKIHIIHSMPLTGKPSPGGRGLVVISSYSGRSTSCTSCRCRTDTDRSGRPSFQPDEPRENRHSVHPALPPAHAGAPG